MFMNVGYTPPAPTWPPKKTSGMGMGAVSAYCIPCGPGYADTGRGFCVGVTPATRFKSHPKVCHVSGGMQGYEPQNFVTPQRLVNVLRSAQIEIPHGWGSGMGCCSSCSHGGPCSGHSHGMGLFDSGTDISGWGLPEWGIVGVAAAAGLSLLSNISSGAKSARRAIRRRR